MRARVVLRLRMHVVILVLACGCAGSMRFEGGVRSDIDGELGLRFGVSTGAGIGEAARSEPRPVPKSLGQFVGYVRSGEHDTASTTTRHLRGVGPLLVNAAIEVAGDGVAVLPAILVPVSRRSECPWYSSVCDEWRAYSVGLQLRAGRDDGNTTLGVDVVSRPTASPTCSSTRATDFRSRRVGRSARRRTW